MSTKMWATRLPVKTITQMKAMVYHKVYESQAQAVVKLVDERAATVPALPEEQARMIKLPEKKKVLDGEKVTRRKKADPVAEYHKRMKVLEMLRAGQVFAVADLSTKEGA